MDRPLDKLRPEPDRAKEPKVFGIGFHKTGTTSLGAALEILGYRVCHGARPVRSALGHRAMMRYLHAGVFDPIFRVAERFDGFRDNPWYCLYREIDARFPGSRFVLTVRDPDRWLASVVNHFGRSESDFRRWIYGSGSPIGNEDVFRERFVRHGEEVEAHFAQRPDDLLVLSLEGGHGWAELCGFLGRPVPEAPFPHANRGSYGSRPARWLRRLLGP